MWAALQMGLGGYPWQPLWQRTLSTSIAQHGVLVNKRQTKTTSTVSRLMISGIFYSVKGEHHPCWDRWALLYTGNVFPCIDYRDFVRPTIKAFFMLRARPDVSHSVTTWIGFIRPQICKAAHLWAAWKQTGIPFSMNPLWLPWDMEGTGEWRSFFLLKHTHYKL